ncbi:MAG: uracil-DNA glycosylase [Actinomycetota bacterium]|nr:uracil-DNA glycosylase [Actinomycetota bacterium]
MHGSPSAPKLFADPAAVRAREARLHEPHIAELTELVERIRMARGGDNSVPWFDPDSGGRNAEILLLFEAPGARAVGPGAVRPNRPGSGFISPDNNDDSAAAVFELEREAGLSRDRLLHWNIVPWYVGDGTRIRAVNKADRAEAAPWLAELLALLPNLRVVVLCGDAAQDGWDDYRGARPEDLWVIRCPHPSPVNLRTRPRSREEILDAFTEAAWIVDPPTCPTCRSAGVPIVYGVPGPELTSAAERGEVLIGGCVITGDDPTHGCAQGHEWSASRPKVSARAARSPAQLSTTAPGPRARDRHAPPHPDAVFGSGLTGRSRDRAALPTRPRYEELDGVDPSRPHRRAG